MTISLSYPIALRHGSHSQRLLNIGDKNNPKKIYFIIIYLNIQQSLLQESSQLECIDTF